ncbi:MAG TPA: dTDP-4-dehydrorhamnose 3,5-epimerase [Polyangiaceae bacterium]|nr:dTDP-4-dehydrorhamnose 3,5-epimerase [Polyangiaceae bacterium]
MKVSATELPGVLLVEPRVFPEPRGWLFESWNAERYAESGIADEFVQDNVSYSVPGVLRGLHFQHPHDQDKLVSVLEGEVYDVVVDVRPDSPTFRRWVGVVLSSDNHRQLWVPVGFAHGFVARKASVVTYKVTAPYAPGSARGVLWSDPALGIDWPVDAPLLSEKDAAAPRLADIPPEHLPRVLRRG